MRLTIRLKVLIFTISIIVVLLAVLHFATSTLVAQNLEEQLRKRAELALENVNIWFSDQKNRLLRQAEILSGSDVLRSALNDPNILYMQQYQEMEISDEIELLLVENMQYDWVYELAKDPTDHGTWLRSWEEYVGERIWQSRGLAGFISIRDGLVLSVTVPVGEAGQRLAVVTLGDLLDQANTEDLVIMSGTEFVHLYNGRKFFTSTLNDTEQQAFIEQFPEDFEENTPYYITMGDNRFLTMVQPLYSPVNEVVSYLVVQFSDENNKQFLRNVTTTMIGVGVLAFGVFSAVSIIFSRRLTDKLKKLVTSISVMGEGDYTTKVAIQTSDEIGLLAGAFDELRVKLKDRTEQLLLTNKDLDSRVHEMESLNTVLVSIASEKALEEVFNTIAWEAAKQFPLDYAFLALRPDFTRSAINVVAHHSFRNSIRSVPQGPLEEGMIRYLEGHNQPRQIQLSDDSSYPDERWLLEHELKTAWLLPIGDEDDRFGFLCLASLEASEGDDHLRDFLRKLSTEITVALQRFRLNEELQLIEGRLQRLFDSMRDGIIQTDPVGTITVYNRAAAEMFGLGETERQIRLQDLFDDRAQFDNLLKLLEQEEYVSGLSATLLDAHGEAFDAEMSLAYTGGERGERGLEGTIRDITTRKKLEDQLVRSERLASMGQIAASVAHEINNPLGIILGFTQDLMSEKKADDPDREALGTIEEETKRCARIVKDLLDLARADKAVRKKIDLKQLIERSMPLFKLHLRDESITARLKLDDIGYIDGDEKQIQQILINVILNAIHALGESGGEIEISLHSEFSQELSQPAAVIAVRDTGHGISTANLERVFDPFFTTKRVGGSGLGLFIVHRLVEAHGGTVVAESEEGEGTTILIKIPILENEE